jgi:hypothetical protein
VRGRINDKEVEGAHLIQLILALLGVVHGGLVAVMPQMPSSYQSIPTIVTRTAGDQDPLSLAEWLQLEHCMQ